jgi:hypothetical protein
MYEGERAKTRNEEVSRVTSSGFTDARVWHKQCGSLALTVVAVGGDRQASSANPQRRAIVHSIGLHGRKAEESRLSDRTL